MRLPCREAGRDPLGEGTILGGIAGDAQGATLRGLRDDQRGFLLGQLPFDDLEEPGRALRDQTHVVERVTANENHQKLSRSPARVPPLCAPATSVQRPPGQPPSSVPLEPPARNVAFFHCTSASRSCACTSTRINIMGFLVPASSKLHDRCGFRPMKFLGVRHFLTIVVETRLHRSPSLGRRDGRSRTRPEASISANKKDLKDGKYPNVPRRRFSRDHERRYREAAVQHSIEANVSLAREQRRV